MSEIVEIVIQFQEILFSALVIRLQDAGRSLCIKVHTKFCLLLFTFVQNSPPHIISGGYAVWMSRGFSVHVRSHSSVQLQQQHFHSFESESCESN